MTTYFKQCLKVWQLRLGELTQSTEDGLTCVKFLIPLWPDLSNSSNKIVNNC